MIEGILLGPLLLFAAVMTFTPGPNVILVTASGANFGFRRTVPQMLGITIGFGSMVMVAGFGFAGLVRAEPRLQTVLKLFGAVYLLWLAWRIARAGDGAAGEGRARPVGLVEAMLFTTMNPKAWVSVFGALATYSSAGADVFAQTAIIAGVLAGSCFLSCMVWAGFGTAIGALISTSRARTMFNRAMAGLLVLSLVPVLR